MEKRAKGSGNGKATSLNKEELEGGPQPPDKFFPRCLFWMRLT